MTVGTGLTRDTQKAVAELLEYARALGLTPEVSSSYRSCEQQWKLYKQGRSSAGNVITWAPGCMSWHTHGRAVDLNLGNVSADYYRVLGEYWESMGGKWGGRFRDDVHFEWHPGVVIESICHGPDYACSYQPGADVGVRAGAVVAGLGIALLGLGVAAYTVLRD